MIVRNFLLIFLFLNVYYVHAEVWTEERLGLFHHSDYLLLALGDEATVFFQGEDFITVRKATQSPQMSEKEVGVGKLSLMKMLALHESMEKTPTILQLYHIDKIMVKNFPVKGNNYECPFYHINHPGATSVKPVGGIEYSITISATISEDHLLIAVCLKDDKRSWSRYFFKYTLEGTTAIFDFNGPEKFSYARFLQFFGAKKDDDSDGGGAGASAGTVY